jgi:hypothetical protein
MKFSTEKQAEVREVFVAKLDEHFAAEGEVTRKPEKLLTRR